MADHERNIADVTPEAIWFMLAFPRRHPDLSALHTTNRFQKIALLACAAAFCLSLAVSWTGTVIVLNGVFLSFYLVVMAFKA